MEPIWLASYPRGIAAEIDLNEFDSVRDIFERSCERFAGNRAFSNMGGVLRYRELARRSRAFGAWLQARGLAKGDRVALMMPNVLAYPVTLFGALSAGLTVVNVNPLFTPRELRDQLQDSEAKAIVVLENFAHTLERVVDETPVETVVTTRLGDLLPAPKSLLVNVVAKYIKRLVPAWRIANAHALPQVLAEGAELTLDRVPLSHEDIAFLQYTGGTTGVAKGVILTHGNIVGNLQQVTLWLSPHLKDGREVIITALPLYHIFSLLANCLTFMKIGGENVLITNPRDLPAFVKTLRRVPFTAMTGVNTLFNALLNTPGFADLDFSRLGMTLGGGMAVQRRVAERWHEVTGVPLLEAYGLTETSPAVCVNPTTLKTYNASIGLPLPATEVSIRDDAGEELGVEAVGELCVRGPQVTPGYWNRPEQTQDAFFEGGWLRTGDMARIDERGYVYIVDRMKDMVVVSGFNVYPTEVENILVSHPDVREAAVIGVADNDQGERLRAYVVAANADLTAQTLVEHCRRELTAYKVPRDIVFRDELPKSNVGKILRRALRDESGDSTAAR